VFGAYLVVFAAALAVVLLLIALFHACDSDEFDEIAVSAVIAIAILLVFVFALALELWMRLFLS
jgi:hypothetical protein